MLCVRQMAGVGEVLRSSRGTGRGVCSTCRRSLRAGTAQRFRPQRVRLRRVSFILQLPACMVGGSVGEAERLVQVDARSRLSLCPTYVCGLASVAEPRRACQPADAFWNKYTQIDMSRARSVCDRHVPIQASTIPETDCVKRTVLYAMGCVLTPVSNKASGVCRQEAKGFADGS
jgi:hypothetical protein